MKIKFEFDSDRPEEMETLQKVLSILPIVAEHPQTAAHGYTSGESTAQTVQGAATSHNSQPAQSTQTNAARPTAAQLIAGMTLKPTESSTIDGGHKISTGDYVVFNDEDWRVEATYRGTIVAINEGGVADVIKTADCTKSNISHDPNPPRAGTAAALLGNEQQQPVATGPVDRNKANELREIATAKVSGQKIEVEAVFEKLKSFGASSIDQLTAANAVLFEEWLMAAGEEPPASDGKFGF